MNGFYSPSSVTYSTGHKLKDPYFCHKDLQIYDVISNSKVNKTPTDGSYGSFSLLYSSLSNTESTSSWSL